MRIGRFHLSWRRVVESVAMVGIAILLALAVQAYVIKPFVVPTPSMASTVAAGDRVLVERFSYHFTSVHRDDVIVFTGHGPIPLLKRVVGLPGDTLSLHHGRLYVNNHPAPDSFVRREDGHPEPTLPAPGPAPWSLQRPYTVPAGQYYVMGDNRADSLDSRYWGTVLRSQILGKAIFVYWPPAHWHGL